MGEQSLELLKKGLDLASKRGAFDLEESSTLLSAYIKLKQELVSYRECKEAGKDLEAGEADRPGKYAKESKTEEKKSTLKKK